MSLRLIHFEWSIHPREDEIRLRFRYLEPGQPFVQMRWLSLDIRRALLAHLTGELGPVHFRIISFALSNDIATAGGWHDDVEIQMERCAPISAEQLGPKTHAQAGWIADIIAMLKEADSAAQR